MAPVPSKVKRDRRCYNKHRNNTTKHVSRTVKLSGSDWVKANKVRVDAEEYHRTGNKALLNKKVKMYLAFNYSDECQEYLPWLDALPAVSSIFSEIGDDRLNQYQKLKICLILKREPRSILVMPVWERVGEYGRDAEQFVPNAWGGFGFANWDKKNIYNWVVNQGEGLGIKDKAIPWELCTAVRFHTKRKPWDSTQFTTVCSEMKQPLVQAPEDIGRIEVSTPEERQHVYNHFVQSLERRQAHNINADDSEDGLGWEMSCDVNSQDCFRDRNPERVGPFATDKLSRRPWGRLAPSDVEPERGWEDQLSRVGRDDDVVNYCTCQPCYSDTKDLSGEHDEITDQCRQFVAYDGFLHWPEFEGNPAFRFPDRRCMDFPLNSLRPSIQNEAAASRRQAALMTLSGADFVRRCELAAAESMTINEQFGWPEGCFPEQADKFCAEVLDGVRDGVYGYVGGCVGGYVGDYVEGERRVFPIKVGMDSKAADTLLSGLMANSHMIDLLEIEEMQLGD